MKTDTCSRTVFGSVFDTLNCIYSVSPDVENKLNNPTHLKHDMLFENMLDASNLILRELHGFAGAVEHRSVRCQLGNVCKLLCIR